MRAPAESAGGLKRCALVALGIALVFVFGRGTSLPYVSAASHGVIEHPVSHEHGATTKVTRQHAPQHRAHHAMFRVNDDDDDDDDDDDSLAVTYWNDLVAAPTLPPPSVPTFVSDGVVMLVRQPRTMTSREGPRPYDARGPPRRCIG